MEKIQARLKQIPSIDSILQAAKEDAILQHTEKNVLKQVIQLAVECARRQIKLGRQEGVTIAEMVSATQRILQDRFGNSLCRVINATGIVIHTNLGRAPLSERAKQAVNNILDGYSNLEYDLKKGQRGSRYQHVVNQICLLTYAEDAIVVNNNAGAVLLVLAALAKDKQVVISRGELVEIGGSFRIPDVLVQSGATLVEVGTTNKTAIKDYQQAITEHTGLIMKVHTSNYKIIGFTAQPLRKELAQLAKEHQVPMVEDLGSGLLGKLPGTHEEPTIKEVLDGGVDIVTFSGDKLLGGSQAGIIAGKKRYIDQIKTHPLLRALRIDKLCLAALVGTLEDYLYEPSASIPILTMLNKTESDLKSQAQQLKSMLELSCFKHWRVEVEAVDSFAGGGTLPGIIFPSYGISIKTRSASWLESKLRHSPTPIISRIQTEKVLLDVRCINIEDMKVIQAACLQIVQEEPQ